jgi:hypothetical protein
VRGKLRLGDVGDGHGVSAVGDQRDFLPARNGADSGANQLETALGMPSRGNRQSRRRNTTASTAS